MIKKISALVLLFVGLVNLQAQISNPVVWSAVSNKIDANEFEIVVTAKVEDHWHIYSQHLNEDEGPIATEITFEGSGIELIGNTSEPKGITAFDNTFEMEITYHEGKVDFKQKIKTLENFKDPVNITAFFMVCDDEKCLPPEEVSLTASLLGGAIDQAVVNDTVLDARDIELSKKLKLDIKSTSEFKISKTAKKSLWSLFFLGFVGGFIALLTPCVFPMIPLTVSFFSHSSGSAKGGLVKALMYGFFIVITYVLVSVPFHLLDSVNPDILNNVSTNSWLNISFFIVFVIFAISFFGYFEITLPSKWSNAMDSKATQLGGGLGVFFMALTLVLVSFSCTGPILGSLLGGSLTNDGGAIQLTYGLAGFGLALALPFAFFALFPNLLKKLPKSGGWMTTVKVVLGFVELAFALKFLSNADLVQHWGLLKREVFVALWIVIALGLAAYLFGLYKFPHDAPNQKISIVRKSLGLVVIVFAGYLVPGLLKTDEANLKLLSGFPPPMVYSIYPEQAKLFSAHAYTDFYEGLAEARKQQKPILIDFTGWACVNCRKMEENVWSDSKVKQVLENDVILISLYVDDRKKLPVKDQFNFLYPETKNIKRIKTIGNKWATFQTVNFKNNSQPYYVLMNTDFKLLQQPIGNTPDKTEYYNWLVSGVENLKDK